MGAVPPSVMIVRARAGVVRESRRVCHVVPVPDLSLEPVSFTAYCGARIAPGESELVSGPFGMPCVPCLARVPVPELAELERPRSE